MARPYKTRDPQTMQRDPVIETAPPLPNEDRPAVLVQVPTVPTVHCLRCGGVKFNNNSATRPSLAADKMTRRKQCMQCGQWHVMQSEPTEIERARYWGKAEK